MRATMITSGAAFATAAGGLGCAVYRGAAGGFPGSDLDAAAAPLIVTVVLGVALAARWRGRVTAATLLCAALAFTQVMTNSGALWSVESPLGGLTTRPYPGLMKWADGLTTAAIGLGLVAAVLSVASGELRGRRFPVGTAVALPVLAVAALAADAVAGFRERFPDADSAVSHHGRIALVAFLVGIALAWRGGGVARGLGAVALMAPLAWRLWDLRPEWLRWSLGEEGQSGVWGIQGSSSPGLADVVRDLLGDGSWMLLQFAMVLAALVGAVRLCSPAKGAGEHTAGT